MMLFQWDAAKSESHRRKHGVSFEDAIHVFNDPFALLESDRIVEGEIRWQTIGLIGDITVLLVAHTVKEAGQDEIIRIISARRATRTERIRYGKNRHENFG